MQHGNGMRVDRSKILAAEMSYLMVVLVLDGDGFCDARCWWLPAAVILSCGSSCGIHFESLSAPC